MISNLFPKNPVFMCFGGGGSGGSSSGAASSGGGSRADRKGAAAVFSAPKPVYTPPKPTVVNTSRDRRDRTPAVNYGALPSSPPPSVIASAPSVTDNLNNVQLVSNEDPFKTNDIVNVAENALNNVSGIVNVAENALDTPRYMTSGTPSLRPKDLSIDPISMDGDNGALGQVSRYGVYAGDGFEFKDSGQGFQTRTYTGAPETMNNLGQDVIIANEIAYGSPEDRERFRKIGQASFDEGSEFALSPGSANDGDWVNFIKTGKFGASPSFVDQYGLRNAEPVVGGEQVGALSSVASGNAPQFATTTANYTGLENVYNSQGEEMANFFTPDDGASYVRGQLIDDATGLPLKPGDKASSTGKVIRGTFDNQTNNIEGFGGLGGAPILNSSRETMANLLTPGDRAAYVNGQLVNTMTGESLEGGGYTYDAEGKNPDYVYGVSDDFSNNLQVDTTGMDTGAANAAIANQIMKRDIPPSDLAYFTSFLPGMTVPLIGGYLGEKMLEGGINDRKAVIAEQTAALQAGATPIYNDKGEYVGYNDGTSTVNYDPSISRSNSNDRIDQNSTSVFSQAREARMSGSDDNNDTSRSDVANDIFNRYYKGGSGVGMPDWLRRYASGIRIDELLTKETLDDGTVMYKTPDGTYIEEKYLTGARMSEDEDSTRMPEGTDKKGEFNNELIPEIDQGFYDSDIYKNFINDEANSVGSMDVYDSPYFGRISSGSFGKAQDRAYEEYLASLN